MATMNVPTFTALSAVEQCEQLESYLKELNPSLSFSKVDRLTLASNLKEIIPPLDVLQTKKEAEVESVLNSVVTLLFELPLNLEESKSIISAFASKLADSTNDKLAPVCLRVVKNLHDGLSESLDLQYITYVAMVKLSSKAKRLSDVFDNLDFIKKKYSVEKVGLDRAQNLYRQLNASALECGQGDLASRIMIELLSTYSEENASQAEKDAITCITSSLKDPNTFLMDHLLALKPVNFLEGKPIFDLLNIFVSEKLQDYIDFYSKQKSFVDGLGLNHEQNMQKMRLLTFMQMAECQKEISYDTVMSELKLSKDEVEPFVFDVLRTQLVRAKIDQLNKKAGHVIMPNLSVKKFMVFNSSEGQDESREYDKLLYHWVKASDDHQTSLNEQIDDVCLCDATVNVSNRLNGIITTSEDGRGDRDEEQSLDVQHQERKFNENKSLTLYFDNTLVLIVEVEPRRNIWMAMHVADNSLSDTISEASQGLSSQQSHPSDPKNFPTEAIKRVINNIYARFCLLNGSFHNIACQIEQDDATKDQDTEITCARVRDSLRSICRNFFEPLLAETHLSSVLSNLALLYNFILYLDINSLTLMTVNSFINHLVCLDAVKIRYTIVIFNDKLLWSSLGKHDTRLLYNYLVSSLIKDALQDELSKEVDKVRRIADEMPIYLTKETPDEDNQTNEITIQDRNILSDLLSEGSKKCEKFYMTVFRSSNNLTLGLILSSDGEYELLQKCEQVLTSDSRLGVVPLASLAQSVGQNFIKANTIPTTSQGSKQQDKQSSSSFAAWKRQPVTSSKSPSDHKYILIDQIHASISWPISMDLQSKDYLLMPTSESNTMDYPSSRKFRLVRHLIELEPELTEIERGTGSRVGEFYCKNSNDYWLTINNCKYRSIYSVNKVRNSSLTEAQESAINLRSILTGGVG